jgi:hypothetical protein
LAWGYDSIVKHMVDHTMPVCPSDDITWTIGNGALGVLVPGGSWG